MLKNESQNFYRRVSGLPSWLSGKEPAFQYRRLKRCKFDLWVRKIPCRSKWQPTAVLLPGKSPRTEKPGGLQSMQSQRIRHGLKRLSMHAHLPKGLTRFSEKNCKEVSSFRVLSKKRSQLHVKNLHHRRLLN